MRQIFRAIHRFGGAPTLHVFYHIVTDDTAPHVRGLYPVRSVRQFREDMDWLLRHFIPVTLDELAALPSARPGFHVSFDDGLRQCYDTITPVLLEKGIPATFFINPDFVDNRALMYRYTASLIVQKRPELRRELLQMTIHDEDTLAQMARQNDIDPEAFLHEYQPYMTLAQIRELANYGFTIGAHSMNHPMYSQIPEPQQVQQTLDSLAWVRAHTPETNPPFAFPFTDFGVKKTFFAHLPPDTFTFGCAGLKKEHQPRHFQRLAMEKTTRRAAAIVESAYAGYLAKLLMGRHVTRR
jgi:peptidoglycan/xylan/chitin deacetylase (PgdA/CDA1 family)